MKRRDFLRATILSVGALAVPACADDSETGTTPGGTTPCAPAVNEAMFPQSVASGDPKPESVILWTRVIDAASAADLDVELEVALDEAFTQPFLIEGAARAKLKAEAAFDHCVKVRLTGLTPATTYHYRFIVTQGASCSASRTGKTRTAPADDADVPVRFAYVSCQDYIGRYYNNYITLAQEELDFFVHLGDYVYETSGDPTFQDAAGERKVTFGDTEGAIDLGGYYAAKSLDNYRDLYRTYRGDRALQAMHEKFPMIAIWDDHEFSDDSHGANASYFDGKQDETDVTRRKAANKAWFEYMPVDYMGAPDFRYDEAAAYPGDLAIQRDFTFGKHVHLVMTDLRTHRAEYLIKEEAFPGAVVLDQAALTAALGAVPADAKPYVDIDDAAYASYKTVLTGGAATLGFDASLVAGPISVAYINSVLTALADPTAPIDPATAGLELGIAYVDLGKNAYNGALGSRYLVVKETFDILSDIAYAADPASQTVMGAEQEAWFLDTMTSSTRTWKVWGNEYCLVPLAIDVSTFSIPDSLKHKFYMNCDAWDGFRGNRSNLLDKLSAVGGVVAVTGDIHAFYAGTPSVNGDPTKKIVEFVGSSISSGTYKTLIKKLVAADPVLSTIPLAAQLAASIDTLFKAEVNPHLAVADSGSNGFSIVEASATELVVTYHVYPEKEVTTDYTGREAELAALYKTIRLKTIAGEAELYQDNEGTWERWDATTRMWV